MYNEQEYLKILNQAMAAEANQRPTAAAQGYRAASRMLLELMDTCASAERDAVISSAERLAQIAEKLESGGDRAHSNAGERAMFAPVPERPGVRFEDIAGLEDAKATILREIIHPMKYPELYARFGQQAGGGILLYGPPGTGKTFLMQEVKRLFERDGALWTFQDTLEYGSSEAPMISAVDPTQAGHSRTIWTTIHQSYSYEEFILGVTTASDSHTLLKITPRPGILLELTEFARQPGCRSLLLADEINRGNVSRLFGEFITCMEPDKRLDEDGGETPTTVSVRLPYLQEGEVLPVPAPGTPLVFHNPMRMPKHVYTLASMNSVDSSTNPLDSALGRRFFRYEVRPDAALLSAHLGVSAGDRRFTPGAVASDPVAIKRLAFLFWSFLNEKIALFAGCDYQLGHSYLWPLASAETGAQALTAFSSAVRHKLIPQLREIFSARPEQLIKPSPIRLLEPDALDEELGASAAILWDGLFSCSDASLSEWVLRLLMEHGAAEPSPAGGA